MPITIKDIAKVAGVSHTTVSRALNGKPIISASTTARIKALAHDMGYVPNIVARSLHSQKTKTIGMVLTTIADPFLARIVEGVEQVAQAANYSLFLSTSHHDPTQEMAVIDTLYRRRVDAIIIASMWVGSTYRADLNRIKIPIVLINHQLEGEQLRSVTIDDIQGAQLAVKHLIELGHQRIGFVKSADRPNIYVQNRLQGYQQAHQQAALMTHDNLILAPQGSHDFERGKRSLDTLLEAKATASFCYNDLTAVGLLKACVEQGVRVPDDLSIVGFDDVEFSDYVSPSLTTIHQPRLTLGQSAMQMALDLLNGKVDVCDRVIPCELVLRESSSPPRRDSVVT